MIGAGQRIKLVLPDVIKVVLITGLVILSWLATYEGILELIKATVGPVDLYYKIAIGFFVVLLMLMIIYILNALFAPMSWWLRTLYVGGYVFLTLLSVGFGFGFYWKIFESSSEATLSAEAAVTQVQSELQTGQARLERLQETLTTLAGLSRQKAIDEREQGNTCPNSRPGDGPRRRLRDRDADSFEFVANFVGNRIEKVKADFADIGSDLKRAVSRDASTIDTRSGTRNAFLRDLNRKLQLTITRFNAFRNDPQLIEARDRFSERATRTVFDNGQGGTFICPDIQLQTTLGGVVKAIDGLPEIEKAEISAVEGSEATFEAFRRLYTTLIGAAQFKLPPSPEELRELQRQAVQSASGGASAAAAEAAQREPGLGSRDYIPLSVALFVDFCILLVSINRPINRFQMLATIAREARDGPIGEVLTKFRDSHRDGLAEELKAFHHIVFDFLGDYYVAVPVGAQNLEARFLSDFFVGIEGLGIVDRAMFPPTFMVRRKLKRLSSPYASERTFRLYRFRHGAWSKIILDAILGRGTTSKVAAPVAAGPTNGSGHGQRQESVFGETPTDVGYGEPMLPPPGRHNRPGDGRSDDRV